MKTIKIKPNTFYVRKDLTDDIGVMPVFPDSYVGMSTTYDIKSNPDTSLFLAESSTVSSDDFVYGEGKISDIYLDLYVNSITQENAQTGAWLDVFMLKPNLDIVEGNMTIVSGNYTAPILYYNSYNDSTSWMVEDFDGTPKDFINDAIFIKTTTDIYSSLRLTITRNKLLNLMYETNRDPPKNDYTWSLGSIIDNIGEELGNAYDWTKYYMGAAGAQLYDLGAGEGEDLTFDITKGSDGLYRVDAQTEEGSGKITQRAYAKRLEPLAYPMSWWISRGAIESDLKQLNRGGAASFDQFEETFVSRCTQLNSIFSQVQTSPDVRDIKDQTLEGPGDTDRFIGYAYANLESSESPSDGMVLRNKLFVENYSGTTSGTQAQATANCFGQDSTSGMPFPQQVTSTIYGIPQPTPIDITTSGTGRPAYAPEIEIVFKINDMPVTTFSTSGGTYTGSQGNHTLDRSFNIIWNDDAHSESSTSDSTPDLTWASRMWRANSSDLAGAVYGSGTNFSPWISFIRTDASSESIDVICNANYWNDVHNVLVGGGTDGNSLGDVTPYKTTVPMGEWVTMRIKLNMYESTGGQNNVSTDYWYNSSGGASIVYFPGLFDTQGKVRSCLLAHGRPWGVNSYPEGVGPYINNGAGVNAQVYGNNAHYPNMTFWTNNMRAINEVGGGDGNHINAWYSKIDDIPNDDKNVDILVDSISFNQWGLNVNNSTVCTENGMGQMIRIPSATFVTPTVKQPADADAITTGTIAVYPTGSGSLTVDNYYAQPAALTASYMSFGFPEKTVIADDKHHAFLFNSFSVGKEKTALPITMVSGGYFTSGTYDGLFALSGQNQWFNNLTVGDDTTELHITGGTGSVDSFVSKGTMTVKSPFTSWVKTGNPLVGAKIINIAQDKMSIVVDKPNVFDIPLNTPLAIELNNTDYKHLAVGSGSIGYYDTAGTANAEPLVQTKKRNGNTIFLSRPILNDDAGSTAYPLTPSLKFGTWNFDFNEQRNNKGQSDNWNAALSPYAKWYNTNYNLTKCTISPYQYWFNMALLNVSSSAVWGAAFGDVTQDHTKVQQTRAYSGIVAVSGGSTLGTSFNERLYNDGVYANNWSIDFSDPSDTILNLNTDFGFGAINSQSESTLPDSDGGLGRVGREFMESGTNYLNLGSYVYVSRPEMNTPFNFIIKPTYMSSYTSLYQCNINTKDAATNKPQVIYGITDPLPICKDLTVLPSVDVSKMEDPQQIAQVTKAQSTDLSFRWNEEGEDINYRLLFVDETLIENKYHKANFIAPLNDETTPKYYTSSSDYITDNGTAFPTTTQYSADIEGVQGWGFKSTVSSELKSAYGSLGSANEFTFTAHIKPSGTGTERAFFFSSGSGVANNVEARMLGNNKVRISIANAISLTSTTTYECDGIQPLAIVLTYNKNLINNNLKLYVNGKLEDTGDYTVTFDSSDQEVTISGSPTLGKFIGYIEEISFHSKCAYVPQNKGNYTLPTSQLSDMSSGVSKKYQARLFLFDYHNVRGASPNQVSRSNTESWKWTGVT